MQIIAAEIPFDFITFKNKLWTGEKINANKNPATIESKIGFKRKKDKTISAKIIPIAVIFLKYPSSILFLRIWNLKTLQWDLDGIDKNQIKKFIS